MALLLHPGPVPLQPLKNALQSALGTQALSVELRVWPDIGDAQAHFFEITPDKKIVWEFADHAHFKTINQIQLLDIPGDVTKGEIFR